MEAIRVVMEGENLSSEEACGLDAETPDDAILRLPRVSLQYLQQGDYGGVGRKPTTLLTVRAEELGVCLARWKSDGGVLPPLVGRLADGTFATAMAKEYPRALCGALADAFMAFVDDVHARKVHWDGSFEPWEDECWASLSVHH